MLLIHRNTAEEIETINKYDEFMRRTGKAMSEDPRLVGAEYADASLFSSSPETFMAVRLRVNRNILSNKPSSFDRAYPSGLMVDVKRAKLTTGNNSIPFDKLLDHVLYSMYVPLDTDPNNPFVHAWNGFTWGHLVRKQCMAAGGIWLVQKNNMCSDAGEYREIIKRAGG